MGNNTGNIKIISGNIPGNTRPVREIIWEIGAGNNGEILPGKYHPGARPFFYVVCGQNFHYMRFSVKIRAICKFSSKFRK